MTFYFGAHLKKTPTITDSLEQVRKLGGNMIQIFVGNPMSGRHKKEAMNKYREIGSGVREYLKRHDTALVIHSPYVLNFANRVVKPSEAYWVRSYYDELVIADMLGAIGCVIHVGKHLKNTVEDGLEYMYISLRYLIHRVIDEKLNVNIILETAAGQGSELLATRDNTFDDLLTFYQRFSDRERQVLKLCVDTAHVFSAGYDIRDDGLLRAMFEKLKDTMALIHLNDSKREYDSHVDRHERIGKGTIGKETLGKVVRYAYEHRIPVILETPDNGYLTEIPWIKKITGYK
jgi:deoxyribonuclease-4